MNPYFETFEKEKSKLLETYFTLLRFRSISANPGEKPSLEACATFLEKKLTDLGGVVERWTVEGHPPVLFASFHSKEPKAKTLLIYNHYDVQPVDPLELWDSPPFEPSLREETVYARGAEDNKGQLFYTLTAFEIFLKQSGSLPFNLKWILEGEEESGSQALHKLVEEKKKELKADGIVIVDVSIPGLNNPSLTLGLRGIITLDLKVTGPKGDLHSGVEGGAVLNPLHYLVEILSKVRGSDGKVLIPGFYDEVKTLSPDDKARFSFPFDQKEYLAFTGVTAEGGEKRSYSPRERSTIRPTLEVNGVSGGYSGDGFKTVIPSFGSAKVSCRLVPDQDPKKMGQRVKDYFESLSIPGAKVEVDLHGGGGKAIRSSPMSPLLKAAAIAVKKTFCKEPELTLEGGSIPIAAALAEHSGGDILFLGTGLPTDAIHAPNEHFSLEQIKLGISLMGYFFENFQQEFTK